MGTALVTGASSGLGEEFCWQLAASGHNLVVVARREDVLNQLAEKIHNYTGVNVEVLVADLGKVKDRARVCTRLTDEEHPVGLLVNNAGYGKDRTFLETPVSVEKTALDVMVTAVMELSHAAAKTMVSRGRGAILNVSSVASDTGMGTYSAHKAWVKAFTEGLAMDLRGTGVTATAVMPGMVNTAFHDRSGFDASTVNSIVWIKAETVVSQALQAVREGRVLVTPSLRYKVSSAATKLAPRWLVREVTSRLPHV
ncbi:oxidoreductase, short chain dehydrogenase/reductase family protein [Gleimia coleocanis DSM 15436]|uniref:Oxidoreductase, short chain dehydrogenase/reductase family protein n=1 Tax=Gleimia coleocanis DSM 15436 TaxID=525245 RepID=C0VYD6_9ACTO|nr:SDR family oxidoreductase [Gleimia coleocanis]EEH64439.1 oxidoreductase, short chain dehydrogenase/reductase family protein [Gleimia coleocanis DSM 15436]